MTDHQGRTLPPFPTDDFTLTQLDHALDASIDFDDDGKRIVVGADFTFSQFLDFMSGYDPERATLIGHTDVIPGTDVPHDHSIPIYESWDEHYTEHSVIRALLSEVVSLRSTLARVRELHREHEHLAMCVDCEGSWPCPTIAVLGSVAPTEDGAA